MKEMGEEMNAVLIEMQTIGLQFDMLSGARDVLNASNVE